MGHFLGGFWSLAPSFGEGVDFLIVFHLLGVSFIGFSVSCDSFASGNEVEVLENGGVRLEEVFLNDKGDKNCVMKFDKNYLAANVNFYS